MNDVTRAAAEYLEQHRQPIPVPYRAKIPVLTGWQNLIITPATFHNHFNGKPQNVGVLLGEPSKGLVDIDIDAREARELAPAFLPKTNAVFGRPSNPRSHWEYEASPLVPTKKYQDPRKSEDKDMLVELRSTGCQTVFPPSTHVTGEPIRWELDGDPEPIPGQLLRGCTDRLAAAALLVRYWPGEGSRHDTAMALAGALLSEGWLAEDAEDFIRSVVEVAGDPEIEDRVRTVSTTQARIATDSPTTGWTRLGELIGQDIITRARGWIGAHFVRGGGAADGGNAQSTGQASTGFPLTDLGNAERLVYHHGQDLRYCEIRGKWYAWTGQRWAEDMTGEVIRRAKKTVRNIYREVADVEDPDKRKELAGWARKSEAGARIREMITLAQSEPGIPVTLDQFDVNPWLLNVENGTLDLETGELRPHDRADLITRLAPVRHDPDADCPRFRAFLNRILAGNADLQHFMQKAAGYSLTGRITERMMLILFGPGRNGKTTLVETFQFLMADYGQRTPIKTILQKKEDGIPNDLARLKGTRFVFTAESNEGRRLDEAGIKDLTGGDTITARFMRGEWFDFKPEFKLWLSTNHKPVIRGTDEAIWDRIRLVPFSVRIPDDEKDPTLSDKLRTELPGILNWALEGCRLWQHEGLAPPAAVKQATAAYREEMDVLADFLEARCIIGPDFKASAKDLYGAYVNWSEENGDRPLSQRGFGGRLSERGFERRRGGSSGAYYWHGIGLRTNDPPSDGLNHSDDLNHSEPKSDITDPVDMFRGATPNKGSEGSEGSEKVQSKSSDRIVEAVTELMDLGEELDYPAFKVETGAADAGLEGWQRFATIAREDAVEEAIQWAQMTRADRAVWGES